MSVIERQDDASGDRVDDRIYIYEMWWLLYGQDSILYTSLQLFVQRNPSNKARLKTRSRFGFSLTYCLVVQPLDPSLTQPTSPQLFYNPSSLLRSSMHISRILVVQPSPRTALLAPVRQSAPAAPTEWRAGLNMITFADHRKKFTALFVGSSENWGKAQGKMERFSLGSLSHMSSHSVPTNRVILIKPICDLGL